MQQYHDLLRLVLTTGSSKSDRTGTGTRSVFGHQTRYDLQAGFPLLSTKKVHWKSVVHELLWFLRGETNNNWLKERRVGIWDEWAREDGDLGPIYGKQWRDWESADGRHIDQIKLLIDQIRNTPASRRQIVSAWNPGELDQMALAPCHCLFQTWVANGKLSLQLYQRSADVFLGVPFNIASYALLTHLVAAQVGLEVGDFVWTGGDCHIYDNHVDQVTEQLSRDPFPLPTLAITTRRDSVFDYEFGDVTIENIEFRGARASDTDGAGVRQEGGRLRLIDCAFYDNEHGVVAMNDPDAELDIQRSLFGMAPKVEGGLHHLLSVGRIGKLTLTGSRFQQGFEGHMIKSRARESLIAYNFIHDGQRGGASYEIDLPAGGLATVVGNVIGQGSESQNRVMVAYGSEGQAWERNALHVAHNTFVNYKATPAWFLRVWKDRLPADTTVVAINNLLVGPGVFWLGASGRFEGNRPATLGMLRDAETYAFELTPNSMWRHSGVDPRNVGGRNLAPQAEFNWPQGVSLLSPQRSTWAPGAYQR